MTDRQTYALSPISKEQHDILELVRIGGNINIDAVAGSGKTTTSLYIAKNNPHRQILLLTYNAKLKLETREKAKQLGLSNI
jgi:superfamily I DNA and RNA helicase